MPHQDPITSAPQLFALLVENRETIILLAPFFNGPYDVAIEVRTDVNAKKFYWCRIKKVYPTPLDTYWEVASAKDNLVDAVRDTANQAREKANL